MNPVFIKKRRENAERLSPLNMCQNLQWWSCQPVALRIASQEGMRKVLILLQRFQDMTLKRLDVGILAPELLENKFLMFLSHEILVICYGSTKKLIFSSYNKSSLTLFRSLWKPGLIQFTYMEFEGIISDHNFQPPVYH